MTTTEKRMDKLARQTALADIKRDRENSVPLYMIRRTPSSIRIPKLQIVLI